MKHFKFLLFLFLIGTGLSSHAQAFANRKFVATVGYGGPYIFNTFLKNSIRGRGGSRGMADAYTYEAKSFGPLLAKFDYGLSKVVSVGAVIGYASTNLKETFDYSIGYSQPNGSYNYVSYQEITNYHYTSFSLAARMNFHFATKNKLDPYAGFATGYNWNSHSVSFSSDNPYSYLNPYHFNSDWPWPYLSITIGMRYYFSKHVGAYIEMGYEKFSLVQGGLAVKF